MATPRTRPRVLGASPSAWVRRLTISLTLALFPLVVAAAPPDSAAGSELLQVLGCLVVLEVPSPAAEAADGGFAFSYQSLGGRAEDGRSCTVYRLQNRPGSPPTPVRWSAGEEVLVDLARLKRCGSQEQCGWFEVARYFDGGFDDGRTQLGFGLNADSFRFESDGLIARAEPDVGSSSASVGTEVVGTLTLADDTELELDLIVKSRFERRSGVIALLYEVTSPDPAQLSGQRVALVWRRPEVRAGTPATDPRARPPAATFAPPFLALPGPAAVGGPAPAGVRRGDTVVVERLVEELAYEADLVLDVVETGHPDVVLLSVPLPAFVPPPP